MPTITTTGVLPGILLENTGPTGWVGNLALSGNLSQLRSIELIGAGASYFTASFSATNGLATITPAAKVDYEALAAAGLATDLQFSLVFNFADGSSQAESTVRHVQVQNLDDTPPTAVTFISGGTVNAGDVGATIGTLLVSDPDTPDGPFYISFAPEYDWMLQLDGSTLRLRDGVSLQLDWIGTWTVFMLVSDGANAAAFGLNVTINPPGTQQDVLPFIQPGQVISGFSCTAAGKLASSQSVAALAALEGYDSSTWQVVLQDGNGIWLPLLQQITFSDGTLTQGANGLVLRYTPPAGSTPAAANTTTALGGSTGSDSFDFSALNGGAFKVSLEGMAGDDTLSGSGGFRTEVSYNSSPAAVLVDLAAGTAQDGWGGTDSLGNINRVSATSSYDDTLRGTAGADLFITGTGGNKLVDGRGGQDWYRYAGATGVVITLGSGTNANGDYTGTAVRAGAGGTDTLIAIEEAAGGTGNDSITGSAGDNLLIGDAGNNTITGGGGNDTVSYDASAIGGSAPSRGVVAVLPYGYVLGSATNAWGGTDKLVGIGSLSATGFADSLTGAYLGTTPSYLAGLAGNDTIKAPFANTMVTADYSQDPAGVVVNLTTQRATDGWGGTDTLVNIQAVRGSAYGDTIIGNAASDYIWGGGGNDVITAGSGAASITLGIGNSAVYVSSSSHVVSAPVNGGDDTIYSSATYVLPANVAHLVLTGTANINGYGGSTAHSLLGNSGNNWLVAGSGAATLDGGLGNDTLIGGALTASLQGGDGNDWVQGGGGAATLDGGAGNDTLIGGSGATLLLGGDGNDWLWRGTGKLTVDGGNGDDVIIGNDLGCSLAGGPGNDTIYGGTGDDIIDSGGGSINWLMPGTGNDTVYVHGLYDVIIAPANNNTNVITDSNYFLGANLHLLTMAAGAGSIYGVGSNVDCRIVGNEGNNTLYAGSANCTLEGNAGNDLIYAGAKGCVALGGDGNDWIVGNAGTGTLDGGAGNDTMFAGNGAYAISGGDGADWIYGGTKDNTIDGGAGDDVIYGSSGSELLLGGAGNDVIWGGGGNDTIDPGPGFSWLFPGLGSTTIYVHSQWDVTYAGPGYDVTIIADCNYNLYAYVTKLYMAAGAGNLYAAGNTSNDLLVGNEGNNTLVSGTGNCTLMGMDGNDYLYAGVGACSLVGGNGNDWMLGSSGSATLDGGAGNDTITAGSGASVITGGDGDDWRSGGSGASNIQGGNGNDTITASTTSSTIDGGAGNNWIIVNSGTAAITVHSLGDVVDVKSAAANVTVTAWSDWNLYANIKTLILAEGAGDISGAGNAAACLLRGNSGNNKLTAGSGNTTLDGGAGNDTLQAGAGQCSLLGGAGDDSLVGGPGNDTLVGGTGADTLYGGGGADLFLFNTGDGADTLLDFNPAADVLKLVGTGLDLGGLLALATQQGGATTIDFGNGGVLTLNGVALTALNASDVLFA